MSTAKTCSYQLPSEAEILALDMYDEVFSQQVAISLRWLLERLPLTREELCQQMQGITAGTLKKYQAASFNDRALHVVAAISWVTQMSMAAILKGERIAQYWKGVSQEKIDVLVIAGLLANDDFTFLFTQAVAAKELSKDRKSELIHRLSQIRTIDYDLNKPPIPLDIKAFRIEYYGSIAQSLIDFRQRIKKKPAYMARVLRMTIDKYDACENVKNPPRAINLITAARLKLAFKIEDTASFLSYMTTYSGCMATRSAQQAREQLLLDLLCDSNTDSCIELSRSATQLVEFRKNIAKFSI